MNITDPITTAKLARSKLHTLKKDRSTILDSHRMDIPKSEESTSSKGFGGLQKSSSMAAIQIKSSAKLNELIMPAPILLPKNNYTDLISKRAKEKR